MISIDGKVSMDNLKELQNMDILPDIRASDYMELLHEDFNDIFDADLQLANNDSTLNGINENDFTQNNFYVQNDIEQQRYSDGSLSGTSPNPSSPFSYQYSPGSGSVDSGVQNSIDMSLPDTPEQSPDPMNYSHNSLYANNPVNQFYNMDNVFPNRVDLTLQKETLDRYIQEQVSQALQQHQTKEQLQLQQQIQQHKLLLLSQHQKLLQEKPNQTLQQQEEQNFSELDESVISDSPPVNKSENQLRKMFTNKKNNIVNAFQEKKGKIQGKFPKTASNKSNKRKLSNAANTDGKLDQLLPEETNANLKSPLTMLLMQKSVKHNTGNTDHTVESGHVLSQSPYGMPNKLDVSGKIQIQRLISHSPTLVAQSVKTKHPPAKKTRVEHVVIEKRYRMKITDSLNELKNMLPCSEVAKATKNGILQASIDELRRLQKENEALNRKNQKLMRLFSELRRIGIIPNTPISSASSESNVSDSVSSNSLLNTKEENIDPEINQDHYASPLQRQSAKDGAKFITCMALFTFLFISPLSSLLKGQNMATAESHFSSRHLLSIEEQESSAKFSLASNLINIIISFFLLMFILLRGNPKCPKNAKRMQCFNSQLAKAQMKLNKHEYEDAKGLIRIGLFVIGNSCPKSPHGQLASFTWKCLCHILYQLGLLTTIEAIGRMLLPRRLSCIDERPHQQYTAKMSAEAYIKLHEIAIKDRNSTYLETACYIMNAVNAAEVSSDEELLCTAYATAVIHMQEKVHWFSCLLQYYFIGCAHHVSLASKDNRVFAVDWIFESRGYGFFSSGLWDIRKKSVFHVNNEESDLNEVNLLQQVYTQFQEFLLIKALKRMVLPNTFYPNEGKVELQQRAHSFSEDLGVGPVSEQIDAVSIHLQSVYGWWGSLLKQLLALRKKLRADQDELTVQEEMFTEVNNADRHELMVMTECVFSAFVCVITLKECVLSPVEFDEEVEAIQMKLEEASHFTKKFLQNKEPNVIEELLVILCSDLLARTTYMLWEIAPMKKTKEELCYLQFNNQVVLSLSHKYPELAYMAQQRDLETQKMSGSNHTQLLRQLKRSQQLRSVCNQKSDVNNFYLMGHNTFPLKLDGFCL